MQAYYLCVSLACICRLCTCLEYRPGHPTYQPQSSFMMKYTGQHRGIMQRENPWWGCCLNALYTMTGNWELGHTFQLSILWQKFSFHIANYMQVLLSHGFGRLKAVFNTWKSSYDLRIIQESCGSRTHFIQHCPNWYGETWIRTLFRLKRLN